MSKAEESKGGRPPTPLLIAPSKLDDTPPVKDHAGDAKLCLEATNVVKAKAHRLVVDLATEEKVGEPIPSSASSNSHGHGQDSPLLATAVVSGVINWLLMFGLCCAYGMILFSDSWHESHRGLGVKMNLATGFFVGLGLAGMSSVPVAIGGPDLNPTVFLAGFVEVIGPQIADQLGLEYPDDGARRLSLGDNLRRLAADSARPAVDFCMGEHLAAYGEECADYQEQLRATVIFATFASSAILAIVFFSTGKFKLVRFASYVPLCVMEAFLSCVGYKVFKYALKFCEFDPVQFVPAGIVGVTMYFVKVKHIGYPPVMIPLIMLVPLTVFYIIVFASGHDIDWARSNGFMFPEMQDVEFWSVWTDSVLKFDKINVTAWSKTLPNVLTMLVVVVLDSFLKMLGTEAKLGLKFDKDREAKLYGVTNLMSMCSAGPVGYMQLKFNVINRGVMGNLVDRRAGAVYALLAGAGFFGTIQPFNFMPRFFLSMLLFFAGAGFVAENLWGSRFHMNIREWMQVIIILAVFIVSESMLWAVMVGGLLTCFDFLVSSAQVPCVLGKPLRGGELTSADRHHPIVHKGLQHLTNTWCRVIRLKGFIFLGSAQAVVDYIAELVEAQKNLPHYRRVRYVILDCKLVDGMDASASKALKRVEVPSKALDIQFLWSHPKRHLVEDFSMRRLVESHEDWFRDLNHAILYVEGLAYKYLIKQQQRWLNVHPAFAFYHRLHQEQAMLDPFQNILTMESMKHGCPWRYCSRIIFKKRRTVLWEPEQFNVGLFLVHTGAVAVFEEMPEEEDAWHSPIAVYRHGWFLNPEMLVKGRTQHVAVAVESGEALCWSESQWFKMTHDHPHMASAIAKAVRVQQSFDWRLFQMQPDRSVPKEEHITLQHVHDCRKKARAKVPEVPEVVQNHFDAIQTAQVLESYGLYASPVAKRDDEAPAINHADMPHLPSNVLSDLDCAFTTYSIRDANYMTGSGTEECGFIPGHRVADALLYAGFPKALIPLHAPDIQNFKVFKEVARSAIMAAFDETQMQHIETVFNAYDVDKRGALYLEELGVVLKETFHPLISAEESVSMTRLWDIDKSGKLDLKEFVQLVSRFTRLYEPEWCFTLALRELIGADTVSKQDLITVETLQQHARVELSEDCFEEMIWAADWLSGGEGKGRRVGAWNIISILLMNLSKSTGKLPPEPRDKVKTIFNDDIAASFNNAEMEDLIKELADSGINVILPSRQVSPLSPMDRTISAQDLRVTCIRDELLGQEGDKWRESFPTTRQSSLLCITTTIDFDDHHPGLEDDPELVTLSQKLDAMLNDPKRWSGACIWLTVTMLVLAIALAALVAEPLLDSEDFKHLWVAIEILFTTVATVDLGMRWYTSAAIGRTARAFFSDVTNICDCISVLPFFLDLLVPAGEDVFDLIRISRLVRVSRAIRVIRAQAEGDASTIVAVLAVIWGIYLKSK